MTPLIDLMAPDIIEQYQEFVLSRIDPQVKALGSLGVIKWAIAKLNEEQAEAAKPLVMQEYHSVEYDPKEVQLENGDCLFYVTVIALFSGSNLRHLMQQNIEKLSTQSGTYQEHLARKYGDRYTGPRKDASDQEADRLVAAMHRNDHLSAGEQYQALLREIGRPVPQDYEVEDGRYLGRDTPFVDAQDYGEDERHIWERPFWHLHEHTHKRKGKPSVTHAARHVHYTRTDGKPYDPHIMPKEKSP